MTSASASRTIRAVLVAIALVFPPSLLALTVFPPVALAQQDAAVHFGRGKELYNEGDYQGALVEFERAYKLSPNWRVLFNIGQVKYQMQDYPGAMDALEQYLTDGGSNISKERRAQVLADIERLRSRVAYLTIQVNEPGATVLIDDREVGTAPLDGQVRVSAGRRKVTATVEGAPAASKFVEVAGGDTAKVALEIARPAVPPDPSPYPTPDPEKPTAQPKSIPWAAWGVTAGLGVGALVFGLLALDAATELDTVKGRETTKDELEDNRSRVLGFSVATDVLLGASVIMAAVSIYLTVDAATSDSSSASVGVRLAPGFAALEGEF